MSESDLLPMAKSRIHETTDDVVIGSSASGGIAVAAARPGAGPG